LLALDEISECDPREVGAIVYQLGNGRGKQRASRSGAAKPIAQWDVFLLSSGEHTIATAMAEGGHREKAGQAVRLLDVRVARKYGAWDELHGFASGTALSDAIKRAAATDYGHAGRSFIEKLTGDDRDFCWALERLKNLPEFCPEGGEGQEKRAATRFALVAMAGELATEYGITGWPEGLARAAAGEFFRIWRASRGRGNSERRDILEKLADFIDRHGDSRFLCAAGHSGLPVRDRAGWWRDTDDGRVYLFTSGGLREALTGFDFNKCKSVLREAGALPEPGATGELSQPTRVKGERDPKRLYWINAEKLRAALPLQT